MGKVQSIQSHLFKKIYKALDQLDKIADNMEGYSKDLEKLEQQDDVPKSKPVLRLVK